MAGRDGAGRRLTALADGPTRLLRETRRAVRTDVARCIAAGLAWQVVAVAVPWVAERAVDDGLVPGDRGRLVRWAAILAGLGLVRWAGDAARHWWVERAGAAAALHLRARLLGHVLELDDDALEGLDRGDLVSRATTDVDAVWAWVSGLATLVTAAFTLVAVTALLLLLDPVLALVGLVAVPVVALVTLREVGAQHRAARAVADATGAYAGGIDEAVAGAAMLRGIGGQGVQHRRVAARSAGLGAAARRLAGIEASWVSASVAVPAAGIAAGVWLGGTRALDGSIQVGALVAFAGWMGMLADAAQTLAERLATRGEARAAAARVLDVLSRPATRREPVAAEAGHVRLEGVRVEAGRRLVLERFDLAVAPGEWLALVGPTGSGKTSVLRLLAGRSAPAAGTVGVGGPVGWVPQRPVLFSGTVGQNVRLARPDATEDEVRAALLAVDAPELAAELDRPVGAGGLGLSGGQRQRLALARALLARPAVLVLDDPTSALDPATERRVLDGLRHAAPGATVVLATHRTAAADAADRAVQL